MRILELPSWYTTPGNPISGIFVQHQALALREQGVDVHILANMSLSWTVYHWDYFNLHQYPLHPIIGMEDGILVYRHYHRSIPKMPISSIRSWARQTARLYDDYSRRFGHPDLIHVHSGTWGAYAASLIKQKHGIPYVVTEHRGMFGCHCELARSFFQKEFTPFFQEGFSHADMLIPVSEQLIPKMSEYLTRPVPFRVVSNIVDTDFFCPPDKPRTMRTPFRFVCVNGFLPVKAYDTMLAAWDILCDSLEKKATVAPSNAIELRIVGENFDCPEFQQLLAQCRHRDKISFAGEVRRDGVLRELHSANAYVISSRVESQSVSTLEALSTGLPVVATEVVPEYVLPSEIGFRVPVERPELLAQRMEQVLAEYDHWNQPERIREHTRAIAHKENVAQQLIQLYQSILSAS